MMQQIKDERKAHGEHWDNLLQSKIELLENQKLHYELENNN